MTTPETAPGRRPAGGKRFGGLPAWAWVAIAGGGALIWWVWHKNQQAQAAATPGQAQPGAGGRFPGGGAFGPAGGRVVVPVDQGASHEEIQDLQDMNKRIYEAILDLQGQRARENGDRDRDRDRDRDGDIRRITDPDERQPTWPPPGRDRRRRDRDEQQKVIVVR